MQCLQDFIDSRSNNDTFNTSYFQKGVLKIASGHNFSKKDEEN